MIDRCVAMTGVTVLALGLWGCTQLAPVSSTSSARHSLGRVISVADGDTVTVRLDADSTRSVRLLAIDSPEKYSTRYGSPKECGSLAASAFMGHFVGVRIVLLADAGQDESDRYGRLLRYVELTDGRDLGAIEVARGLAMPYVYRSPARRYGHYRELAESARNARRGGWGPPCEGDFHSSVPGIQNGL